MIDSGFETTALELLAQIARKTANLQPASLAYTSISGTFYQNTGDNSVQINELSNTSPYRLSAVGDAAGQITFTADSDSDIRSSLIFLGPPSHIGCIFQIRDGVSNSPASVQIDSYSVPNDVLDARGFGSDGVNPISFELRFYTVV
jgi:hypothetical protein